MFLRPCLIGLLGLLAVAPGCTSRESTETTTVSDSLADSLDLASPADHSVAAPGADVAVDTGQVRGVPADSASDVVTPAAGVEGMRAQLRASARALDVAVRDADYAAMDRQALAVRDLVLSLAGHVQPKLNAKDRDRMEFAMHGISEGADRLRQHAVNRKIDGVRAENKTVQSLVTQVLEVTGRAS